uniref:Uncharacterized protein n=1 Tax=Trichobilharzia regenti TaxID=157069 RepID=A0AA85J4I5_TRIRE|nr:unnamed protein product [Trichobilharzia regenti]
MQNRHSRQRYEAKRIVITENNTVSRSAQLDHIAISYRWRGSVGDCRSFWNTCVDTNHALVRARVCLRLNGRRKQLVANPSRPQLDQENKSLFEEKLAKHISEFDSCAHPEEACKNIQAAIHTAVKSVNKVNPNVSKNHWISTASSEMIDARRLIPASSKFNEERKLHKRKLTKSLRKNREQWWVTKAKEMEKASAIGNTRQLFRLIRETGGRRQIISETISEKNGTIISSQDRRLERWKEQYEEQFN